MKRHPIKSRRPIKDIELIEIESEVQIKLYETGADDGYHLFGNEWWVNDQCPASFNYLSLNSLYPDKYFGPETGHPDSSQADGLYNYMQEVYSKLMGTEFVSILELGTGGGEITQAFRRANRDYIAVEGTKSGANKLIEDGIDPNRVRLYNLKFMPALERRFDLAMCTEVAEHIEPFFASKVVENCIRHSDLVWFSAADRNRQAHFHHINEQPIEVWDNLFAHMGFPYFISLSGLFERASRLYLSRDVGRQVGARNG